MILLCIGLLLLTSFTNLSVFLKDIFGFHPLYIVLVLTILSFILGLLGYSASKNGKSYLRVF
jgi:hypothetical protein